ncbi:MAG: hypothetical protein B7733_22665 [Myxococcales bacterium FL481]|nr:MAG: hypothetical protein B7733_22665 [Myxococcales bacterium FL481]
MSLAEIADNKWETEAAKPPVKTIAAFAQISMMVLFVGVFAWMLLFSLIGMVSGTSEGELERRYRQMESGAAQP